MERVNNRIMNETMDETAKELTRWEKAAFTAHKWLLVSIVLGTFIVLFVENSITLRQLGIVMVLAYLFGAAYKWNRLKTIREAKKGETVT